MNDPAATPTTTALQPAWLRGMACCISAFVLAYPFRVHAAPAPDRRPNVLFIAVDDLRPATGAYGDKHAVTPNLDALARSGALCERAYCQQAVCSPSRSSLLTGRRPDSTGVYDLDTHFRKRLPDVVTLPQYFRQHGYRAESIGKIFHRGFDDPPSWDVVIPLPPRPEHASEEFARNEAVFPKHFPPYERAAVPDNTYSDGIIAEKAAARIRALGSGDRPWFMAVGFHKPHLPFVAPARYWEMYDRENLWPPPTREQPDGAPAWAGHKNWELVGTRYTGEGSAILSNPLDVELEKTLRHGYYACVSYVDAQIGKVLDSLKAAGATDSTVVVVWGDHGYHAGDMGFWCKHNNYEWATHSPLVFRVPGRPPGIRVAAPVEFVDVYPTLAELCGLPPPAGTEGRSLAPLLESPGTEAEGHAYSQYPRNLRTPGAMMGYSVRTARWRYTEWLRLSDGKVMARELYDFEQDPLQKRNHAAEPALREVVREHSLLLARAGRNVPELRAKQPD